ncbi:MAG: LPS export ABC transporter permease LptF [Steroidobacteraceae bacterium]|nr:LPS export ABC transporter permease LptF [Steroidobacteraceae bacterium]MDW8260460.1 LPS export ABC transporter permease LptF [Gammaproteobacteria bacterium]
MVLPRYIFREFIGNWLAVALVLSGLVFANQLTRMLERAAEANLPSDVVLAVTALSFGANAEITVPLSLLLAIVLTYGRLGHDGEMTAIRAHGVSVWRSARGIVIFAVCVSLLLAGLTLALEPALARAQQARLDAAYQRAQLSAFDPGRFTQLPGTPIVIHVAGSAADGGLRGLVYLQRSDRALEVIVAERARYASDAAGASLTLTMEDGMRVLGEPGSAIVQQLRFERLRVQLPLPRVERRRDARDTLPTRDLIAAVHPLDRAELQWRWSMPLMCLMLSLAAIPLAQLRPRQGRYARVAPALLLFFLYINLLAAARGAVGRGTLAAVPGLALVHVGVALLLALAWWPPWQRWRRR